MMKSALISVYKKEGVSAFAAELHKLGYRLLSTGGTAKVLREAGLEVTDVSSLTAFPEMLEGRVKTLHPAIHGGILARRERPDDMACLQKLGIATIDLVCVNLYPFAEALQKGLPEAGMIENIDIGGPTLLRAAAKNYQDVTVVTDPADYPAVLEALREEKTRGEVARAAALPLRRRLACKVFELTQAYDRLIAAWFRSTENAADGPEKEEVKTSAEKLSNTSALYETELDEEGEFPPLLQLKFEKVSGLRYGENPHQKAAFYRLPECSDLSLAEARQIHGKELSYNNIQDANAAIELLHEFSRPCVVALKHMNPCGLGLADHLDEAWDKAYASDPVSIFGGIVAANREISSSMAKKMHGIFLEIIIAPSFAPEALAILQQKKNLRLLTLPMSDGRPHQTLKMVSVLDGLLLQERDFRQVSEAELRVMGHIDADGATRRELLEAFLVVKHCKSNAIVLYKNGATVGLGVGQSNRVGACKIALEQAGEKARGAVLASDAFFPMSDSLELAVQAGIRAVIQPGGSIRDEDSVKVADAAGIPMLATGIRHFWH